MPYLASLPTVATLVNFFFNQFSAFFIPCMAGNFWLLPQKRWKGIWKSLKSKQAKFARAKKLTWCHQNLFLFPSQCQALSLAAGPTPQGDGTDTAGLTSPPELTLGINPWVSTQPPDPKCSLLVLGPTLMLWALQVVCTTTEVPPGLQSTHYSGEIRLSAGKNLASEENFRQWTGHWREGFRCSPSSAVTLISTKTYFPIFMLFSTCSHKGYRNHGDQLLSAQGIWQVCNT